MMRRLFWVFAETSFYLGIFGLLAYLIVLANINQFNIIEFVQQMFFN